MTTTSSLEPMNTLPYMAKEVVDVTLKWGDYLDDPWGPSLITESKRGRGGQDSGPDRCGMGRTGHAAAGFEDGGKRSGVKKCSVASKGWEWMSAKQGPRPAVPGTEFCQ